MQTMQHPPHKTALRNERNERSWAWYVVMLLIPCLVIAGYNRKADTSAFAQDSVSPETLGFLETFDALTAPAIPAGWSSTASGSLVPFVTSTTLPDSAPNSLFVPDPNTVGVSQITTAPVQIGSTQSNVVFRNNYITESSFDGGVLDLKIGSGPFQDIIAAGGAFVSGPYNGSITINGGTRSAWTGNSLGYIKSEIVLPPSTRGQMIQLRWQMGTDASIQGTGWRIDTISITNTITSENTTSIAVPNQGAGSLYPSSVTVANVVGAVTTVYVALNGVSHTAPDDLDVMLVAPNGRKVILMSDVGGSTPVNNISLNFQDSNAGPLPDNGPLASGSFQPTNVGDDENFPAPAPPGPPTGNTLSAFNGMNANGVWSLYVVDDNDTNQGTIAAGWQILIVTDATACSLDLSSSLQVFPIIGGSGSFDFLSPFGCDWTVESLSSFVTVTSPATGSGGPETVNFDVAPNMLAGRTGVIKVSNVGVTRFFSVQQPSGCPFALDQTTQQFGASGGPGTVNVSAAGACGWDATTPASWITINSGQQSGNGVVNFTVVANGTGNDRSATITIGARSLTINQSGANHRTPFDFDGDSKADLSTFRPTSGTWYILNSLNGSVAAQQFGLGSDYLVTADYDGDLRSDIAVFRPGNATWYIINSMNGAFRSEQWGLANDRQVAADYDGDGKADIAVWREGNGTWYIKRSSDNQIRIEQFGTSGDFPVARDYDGDGKADLAVFRPGTGTWYVLRSSDAALQTSQFGLSGDKVVAADYDGDGKADVAVWRPSNATWYILGSTSGFISNQFGVSTDALVPADYDGDGKTDIAVERAGTWYILRSSNGSVRTDQWGQTGDLAVPSALIGP